MSIPELWIISGPNGAGTASAPPSLIAEGLSGKITIHQPSAIPDLTAALQQAQRD